MRGTTFKDRRGIYIPDNDPRSNSLSQEERKHIDHLVFNRWPPFLVGAETKVMMFIYARTVLHYQRWAYVSIRMLTDGYPFAEHREDLALIRSNPNKALRDMPISTRMKLDEGDLFVIAPTGLAKSNVQRALTSLTNKGFVVQNQNKNLTEMALNPDASYSMMDILLPKRTTAKASDGRKLKKSKYDLR